MSSPPELEDSAPPPEDAPSDTFGAVVLIDAIVQTRQVVAASLLLWAAGFVVSVLKDIPVPSNPAEALSLSIWSGSFQLLMMVLLVAIAFWAPRAARALGLPSPSRYWGAWIPCVNPVVVIVFSVRLWQVMTEFRVSPGLLFATRGRLEIEL
jgi:hypothetical protein